MARKFDDIRAAAPARPDTAEEPIERVFRRLKAEPDGARALAWMQARVQRVTPVGASEAMLREAEGARRFVEEVLTLTHG